MDLIVTVDNYLRFDPTPLPERAILALTSALTVTNPDDPDDSIILWGRDTHGRFTAPRGFALKLRKGLAQMGINVVWDDQRISIPTSTISLLPFVQERDYQQKAVERMLRIQQGIYEAPPGSGKTISSASFIAAAGQRTIVLVDKVNIATQWRERIYDATGFEAGFIGDGSWEERDITVALRQTLWARRSELDAPGDYKNDGWWASWGALMLDECHAISAETVRALMQKFPARYRIGLSATPDRHDWMTMASRSIIGEIFCRTTDRELEEAGVLVKPRVVAVRTPFVFDWKTIGRDRNGKTYRVDPKRQWQSMLKLLKFDKNRNNLFGRLAAEQRGHTCLVHTDHKGHAHELAAYALAHGWPNDRVLIMTGDQDDAARSEVRAKAEEGDVIILSTIGQEALDIPRLDRFFLVFPTKNDAAVKQMVGRLKRTHESKSEPPIVIDFYDHGCRILAQQFAARRGSYDRDELPLTIV